VHNQSAIHSLFMRLHLNGIEKQKSQLALQFLFQLMCVKMFLIKLALFVLQCSIEKYIRWVFSYKFSYPYWFSRLLEKWYWYWWVFSTHQYNDKNCVKKLVKCAFVLVCQKYSPILILLFKKSRKSEGARKFVMEKPSYTLVYGSMQSKKLPRSMVFPTKPRTIQWMTNTSIGISNSKMTRRLHRKFKIEIDTRVSGFFESQSKFRN
jgi:hypothetical protein